MLLPFLHSILKKAGIDGAIFYTVLSRIIQSAGGVVTIFLVAQFLSKEEQGFYYTFASVLAIQTFFELGLGGIIVQYAAHEMASLSISDTNEISGDLKNKSRLSSLLHFCVKWYSVFSVLLFLFLLSFGYLFFDKYGVSYPQVNWKNPWVLVSLFTALNLLISPGMAMVQGMDKVKEMAKIALIQQSLVISITWISLISGASLYAVAINSACNFIFIVILYTYTPFPSILYNIFKYNGIHKISYRREIFPLQWKIAISWISGYFIFQLFNPVIFAFEGPIVAGQMGMTLTVLSAILGLIVSWTSTKVPKWSLFIAKKDYKALDESTREVIRNSSLVGIVGITIFILALVLIKYLGFPLAYRFLPIWLCTVLFITIPVNNIINCWATYLRCHKKEPFLIQAVIVGSLCALSTFILGKYIGVGGIVVGYVIIVVGVSLPLSFFIFKNKRREYHG